MKTEEHYDVCLESLKTTKDFLIRQIEINRLTIDSYDKLILDLKLQNKEIISEINRINDEMNVYEGK